MAAANAQSISGPVTISGSTSVGKPSCGSWLGDDQCGNVGGSFSTAGMTALSACDPALAAGSYYLTQNVGSDPTADCFPYWRTINLNGFTVTGRFSGATGNSVSGILIYNGTIICERFESGNNTGCIRAATSCPASTYELHHLTVTNTYSGGNGRSMFVDFGAVCGSNKLKVYNNTVTAPTCIDCGRTYAISIQYGSHHLAYNNLIYVQAASNAGQGIAFYGSEGSRQYNNRIVMETSTGTQSGRAILLDGDPSRGCDNCIAEYTKVVANNNRGCRVRSSDGTFVRYNIFLQVVGTACQLGDQDSGDPDITSGTLAYNSFELGPSSRAIEARNLVFTVNNNTTSCTGGSCADTNFAWARSPLGAGATSLTVTTNTTTALPGYNVPPVVMLWADTSATITHTASGNCGGAGTCVP